jgi:hypothetical protein
MAKVAFECVEEDSSFSFTLPDGSNVTVESGKAYSTDDPYEIAELERAEHAVKRVKGKGS